jgi:hypothetical protein
MKKFSTLALILLLSVCSAQADEVFRDAAGRVTGKSRVDSGGATTFYGASGSVVGRASTDSGGTTTFYDAAGRVMGKAQRRK